MPAAKTAAHVFGPVPSRRLGRSLGIDIIPSKTCTYDCIYCQLGRTTRRTIERKAFVRNDAVIRSVERALPTAGKVDFLTLSGSGEPTLHAGIGTLIDTLKEHFGIPVAVLTNGSLLHVPRVADALLNADVVLPTLAADSETTFQCVHRPHPTLRFDAVIEGIASFAARFKNRLWLEVFLLDGVTAIEKTVESMAAIAATINPDKIHLNTATRPPAETFAFPVAEDRLALLAKVLGPRAEVISEFKHRGPKKAIRGTATEKAALSLLKRRPCTAEDIAEAQSLHLVEAVKLLNDISSKGLVCLCRQAGRNYYSVRT